MRRTLSLSKETLRILDDEDLARVVGGHHKPSHNGPNSGSNASGSNNNSCPAVHNHNDHHSTP